MSNFSKTKHKGISGLISIITILFVFSFATVALLQVEAKQISLVHTISDKIVIQSLSASENLNPKFVQCIENPPDVFTALFLLDNNWEENSQLDSVIFFSKQGSTIQNVTGLTYVIDSTNKTIAAQTNNVDVTITVLTIDGNHPLNIKNSTHATFITKLGNKFTIDGPFLC